MGRRRIVVERNSIDLIDFGWSKNLIFRSFPIVNVNAPINEEGRGKGEKRGVIGGWRSPQFVRISAARRRVGNLVQFISRLCSIIVGMTIIWSRLERGRTRAKLPNQPAELTEWIRIARHVDRSPTSLSLSLRFPALLVLFQILDATSKLSYVHARIRAPPSLAEVSRINVPDRVGPREIRCSLIAKQRLIRFSRAAPRGQMDATIWFRIYGSLFIIYIYIYHALFRTRPVSAVLRKLSVLWKSDGKGGGGRNESGKVSREERKRERERNFQRTNDESSNIFNLYVYIYTYSFVKKNIY